MIPFLILLIALITYSWLRLMGLGSRRMEGTVFTVRPLPLLARLHMHAVPVGASLAATIALAALDLVPWALVAAPVLSGAALISLPLRYYVTDRGFRRTFGPFRRWTEFAGVVRSRGGARMAPLPGSRPARIWLSGSRGDDEFLQTLRTLIRNAYKGTTGPTPLPATPKAGGQGSASSPTLPHIAAFRNDV